MICLDISSIRYSMLMYTHLMKTFLNDNKKLYNFDNEFVFYSRYSLAFLNAGVVEGNESFIQGCSFHDGYNTGIGIYGTSNLTIQDNVVHHTVGSCIDVEGVENKLINNLVMYMIAEGTYKRVSLYSFSIISVCITLLL